MVTGKILGIGVGFVALLVAIVVIIVISKKLNIGKTITDAGKGIQDFFNNLIPTASASGDKTVTTERTADGERTTTGTSDVKTVKNPDGSTTTIIDNNLEITESKLTDAELKKLRENADTSFQDAILALDPQDPAFQDKAKKLAEESGITGVDKIEISSSGGIILRQFDKPNDADKVFAFPSLIPLAFAEESVLEEEPQLQRQQSTPKIVDTNTKNINVIDFTDTGQFFEAQSVGGQFVGAVIRPTPIDRTKLLVDENKKPIETASQRANRVFEETGEFVDVKRGATSVKDREPFDFGTNTGSGQRGSTEAATKLTTQQLKEQEALKASQIFDASQISRF